MPDPLTIAEPEINDAVPANMLPGVAVIVPLKSPPTSVIVHVAGTS